MGTKIDNAGIACVNQIPALLAKRNLRCSRTEWYGEHLGPAAATVRSTHGMK